MPRVRPYQRRDGTPVRGHYRRSTPRNLQGTGTQRVRAHRRANGTPVRSHYRTTSEQPAYTGSTSGSGSTIGGAIAIALLILLLIAIFS